jgi:tetratricopeptide (TPR) repeat protein
VNPGTEPKPFDDARWQRAFDVFEDLLDAPAELRARRLDESCGGDPDLRDAVARLFADHERAEGSGFLGSSDHAAGEFGAGASAREAHAFGSGLAGMKLGNYRLERLIATGGMGAVYEAEQENPRRKVAIKVLKPTFAAGATLRRFEIEVEILAGMRHAGIAQVYEAGAHAFRQGAFGFDLPWFAMEYVAGARPLTAHADAENLDRGQRVRLFLAVCDAIAHAHMRGVIHRDLKPGNVLVPAGGAPKVIDFGIARTLPEQDVARATLEGDVLGTPAYMSPEQLEGRVERIDVRTDVYALGALLFELLCGAPPIDVTGLPLAGAIAKLRDAAPRRPRQLAPDLPREYEWILDRALARNPEDRYASVADLAADLGRVLRHEPPVASPPGAVYRARKFVRRHRVSVALGFAALATIAGWIVSLDRALARAVDAEALATARLAHANYEIEKTTNVVTLIDFAIQRARGEYAGEDVPFHAILTNAEQGIEHVAGPAIGAAVALALAQLNVSLGDAAKAEALARRALELLARDPRTTGLELERARAILASSLQQQGRTDESRPIVASTPQLTSGLPDPARAIDVSVEYPRAMQYMLDRNFAAAESALRRMIAAVESPTGDPEGNRFVLRTALVHALRELGRNDEAEAEARRVIAAAEAAPPLNPTCLPDARLALALVLMAAGRSEEGRRIALGIVAPFEEHFGAHHRKTLSLLTNLAEMEFEIAHDDALERTDDLIARRVAAGLADRPDHSHALVLRVRALIEARRYDAADVALRDAAIAVERLAGDHPLRQMLAALDARLRLARGEREPARIALEDALANLEAAGASPYQRAVVKRWLDAARDPGAGDEARDGD